jgi:hydrogenase/urease accessory protein HupE
MRNYFLIILLFLSVCNFLYSHEIRPAYLEIKENKNHSLEITWKQPLMGDYGLPMYPSISAGWMSNSKAQIVYTETYLIKRWKIPANHVSLDGQTIRIDGLEKTITDVLVQITLLNDVSYTYLIKPLQPFVALEIKKVQPPPVWQYIQLGIFHIWSGFDHLLFVLGLILLVKKRSKLIWTITAFTIAHSITLALATLQIVKVSAVFTESAIALSIVFLAVELLRHYKGKDGFAYHYPWLVSFLFGLLHGLGFASALQDVGLPQNNIPLALFLFNIGVETGQLVFVFVILLLLSALYLSKFQLPKWSYKFPAYLIGTLAMYWFIDRLLDIF